VDVGANYGEMILSQHLEPGVRAWAFEPNPTIAECLRKSIKNSGDNIIVEECAVGDISGETTFFVDPRWSGTSTGTAENRTEGSQEIRVPIVRLDQFLLNQGIGSGELLLAKIDIEGGERAALTGLVPVLPLVADYRVQVEILRSSETDIEWMIHNFVLHLVDRQCQSFVPVASLADYHRLIRTGEFYEQDAVLARDPYGGP
jgi:FkbM family methyltransferase